MFKSSVIIAAITTILMVGGNCYAQSCHYEKNVIDALTEVPVRVTQPVTIGKLNNNPLYFKAQSVGIRYRFLKMKYYRYEGFSINEQREIAFRLSTNEEIVIQPRINPADTVEHEYQQHIELMQNGSFFDLHDGVPGVGADLIARDTFF